MAMDVSKYRLNSEDMTVASRLAGIVTMANYQLLWQINKKEPGSSSLPVLAK